MSDFLYDVWDWFRDKILEIITAAIIIGLIGGTVFTLFELHRQHVYFETVTMPAAYAAWCKQTDNPKHLTYDEWRLLLEASKQAKDTEIIPIIIPIHN